MQNNETLKGIKINSFVEQLMLDSPSTKALGKEGATEMVKNLMSNDPGFEQRVLNIGKGDGGGRKV